MNRKIPIVSVLLIAIGVLGGVGFTMMRKPHEQKIPTTTGSASATSPHGKMVALDEFLVNLADTDEPHYLKATVVLEVEEKPEIEAQLERDTPRLRDALITALGRNRFEPLLHPAGKETLKASLKAAANRVLGESVVSNVYFTSFAMQ